jgi:acetylornithine deacetylase/succinyl-diaminopimelate desuccinylase-like protein
VAAPTRTAADAPLFREIAARLAADPAGVYARLTPGQQILVTDTAIVTRIGCDSPKVNARPATAWAEVDCRLLPSTDPDAFLESLKKSLGDPELKFEVLLRAAAGPASPEDGIFKVIAQTLARRFPGTIVGPLLCPGLSENRLFRAAGIRSYGLLPFRLNYYDAAGIHGTNERIRVDWFVEGVAALGEIVMSAATAPPWSPP